MPGVAIGKSMLSGFPGTYARNGDCVISKYQVPSTDSSGPAFGAACVLNQSATGGTISDAAVAEAAGHTPVMTQGANYCFVGFAVREVKTLLPTTFQAQPQLPAIQKYAPGDIADVIERGSVSLVVKDPQGAGWLTGASIWLRLTVNGTYPSAAVGDLETADDSGHMLKLTNCFIGQGPADANDVVEVVLLSRNTP